MAATAGIGVSDVVRRSLARELARERYAQCECGAWLIEDEATGVTDARGCLCDGFGGFIGTEEAAA